MKQPTECFGGPWDGSLVEWTNNDLTIHLPNTHVAKRKGVPPPARFGKYRMSWRHERIVYVWEGEL